MFIPGYDNERIIARGGFATVYRARQRTFQRDVAVKVLELSVGEKRDRRRVERECAAMGRLTGHPHIVWVLDSGFTDDGRPYLTTPFYRRGSLTRRLEAHGPLGLAEVLHAGVAIAGALEAAHRHGILHRDVKPGNILISPYGEPALMDFGIASLTQAETDADPSQNTQAFSVEHAAPEIFDGSPGSVSADVYALCSTLWMLLAGQAAFAPETDEGIARTIYRVQREPVPPLEREDVPESLNGLLRQGMAKDPAERPTSARAFGQALQLVQTELGIPVTPLRVADRDEETGDEDAIAEDAISEERAVPDAAPAEPAAVAGDAPADTPGVPTDRPSPALPSGPDITTITAFGGAMPAGDGVPRAAPPAKPAPWQGRMTKWDLLTPAARAANSDGGSGSGSGGGSPFERPATGKATPDPDRTAANERAANRTARQVPPLTGPPDGVTDVVAATALDATTVLPPSSNGDRPVPASPPTPPDAAPEGPRAEPPDDRTAPVATTPPAPGDGNGNGRGNGKIGTKDGGTKDGGTRAEAKAKGDDAPTVVLSDLPPPPPSAKAPPARQEPVESLPPPPPTATVWPRSSAPAPPAVDAVKPPRTRRQAPALGPTILLIIAALLALVIMFVAFAINRRDADLETVSSASSESTTTVAEPPPTAPPPTTVAPPPTVATTAATAPAPTTVAPPAPQPTSGGPVVATDDPAVQQAAAVAQNAGTALADGRWGDARQLIQGLSPSDAENIRGWGGLDAVTMVVTDARTNGDGSVTMRLGEIAHETVGGQRTSLYCVTWTVGGGRVIGMANQQVIQAPWRDGFVPPAEALPIVQSQCTRL